MRHDDGPVVLPCSSHQIYLSRPVTTESDSASVPLYPKEARLRNLT